MESETLTKEDTPMLVQDKMTPRPIVVSPHIPAADALNMMKDGRFRRLPVVQGSKLVGIVTDRDLRESASANAAVGDIMHKQPLTIQATDRLETAALMMRNNKVGALPVMQNKTLVGIITESDIFDTFLDMMGIRGPGRRLQLTLPDVAGSLANAARIISAYDCNISNIVYSGYGELMVRLEDGNIEGAVAALKKEGYLV